MRRTSGESNRRTYIKVPYGEKDEAKKLGAEWDRGAKCWHIPAGIGDRRPLTDRWRVIEGVPPSKPSGSKPAGARLGRTDLGDFCRTDADGKLIAAKVFGRLGGIAGGSKGGRKRAEVLSPERRREIAMMGVEARRAKQAEKQAKRMMERQGLLGAKAASGMEAEDIIVEEIKITPLE